MSEVTAVGSAAATTAGTSSTVLGPGGNLGKDEFLKMLVAQLRYQDPMNPMDGQQMAAQLAQFSSVEQLIALNDKLETQASSDAALLQSLNNNVALGTIGRSVLAVGDALELPAEHAADTTVTFTVGGAGGSATLEVLDEGGNVVGSRPLGVVGGGKQSASLGGAAAGLAPGAYRYAVKVTDSRGEAVAVQTLVSGTVDGVRYDASGAVLTAGPLAIEVGKVVQVGR
jgi:flagellar basal-body rod modification protein FlgD